jgi:uncharacterized damage-inducible protein DinB
METTGGHGMETSEVAGLAGQAYNERAWHGPNLRSAVRGLDAESALWRPGPARHCIWELVLHCAWWKHQVIGRVTGTRVAFPRPGSDFPPLPARKDDAAWKADVKLLDEVHERLMEALSELSSESLGEAPGGQQYTRGENLLGIAMHDVYHAGQVRLLRRLQTGRAKSVARGRRGRS